MHPGSTRGLYLDSITMLNSVVNGLSTASIHNAVLINNQVSDRPEFSVALAVVNQTVTTVVVPAGAVVSPVTELLFE